MASSDTLTLGLAPTLVVEEALRFGPLTLAPVRECSDAVLREVADRFAGERGAHAECQALITCPEDLRPLVLTVWPLFIFACVTYARRQESSPRGVAFPESFHLLPITDSPNGLIYDSGHSLGIGTVRHLPLRWPVDGPVHLRQGCWDRRIELACTVLARTPIVGAGNAVAVAAGMAADLACAAIERRNQKVQNVATAARTYVLLGSAFEALHCRGSDDWHSYSDVIKRIERLNPASSSLGERVFSEAGLKRPPEPEPGNVATRPMFAAAKLLHLRNTYAHGRAPADSDFTLPAELNKCHPMHAATLILAALVGDDLCRELNCVVPGATNEMIAVEKRLDLPGDLVHAALIDGRDLLDCLAEAIVPAAR